MVLRRLLDRVSASGEGPAGLDVNALDIVARAAEITGRMKSSVDLWFAQNATYHLLERLAGLRERASHGDAVAGHVVVDLERLAATLRLAVPR